MNAFEITRSLHIAAGATALGSLGIPLLARKGSALHTRAGWIYVSAAAAVAFSAPVMCAMRLLDRDPRNDGFALFLLYVALVAFASAWMGVRVLHVGGRAAPHRGRVDLALSTSVVVSGAALAVYGAGARAPLFVVFALLGALLGIGQLRFWLRRSVSRGDAVLEHMGAMGASAIGTVTAFLVVNVHPPAASAVTFLVWFGPGVLGAAAIAGWRRRARRKTRGGSPLASGFRAPVVARPARDP